MEDRILLVYYGVIRYVGQFENGLFYVERSTLAVENDIKSVHPTLAKALMAAAADIGVPQT